MGRGLKTTHGYAKNGVFEKEDMKFSMTSGFLK